MSIPLQKDSESQSKMQSHSKELSKNYRKEAVRWRERGEKGERFVKLGCDENPNSKAPPECKQG